MFKIRSIFKNQLLRDSTPRRTYTSHHAIQATLSPNAPIEEAIAAACEHIGRDISSAQTDDLSTILHSHWFSSAKDLAQMSDAEALAIGVPLKLKSTIQELTAQWISTNEDTPPSNNLKHSTPPPMAAAATTSDTNGAVQIDWNSLPIEQRICPPLHRFGHALSDRPIVSQRGKATKYALAKSEFTPLLHQEFEALLQFGCVKFYGAQMEPIAVVTAEKYADHLRGMLGWLLRVKNVPLNTLSLHLLVPTDQRDGVAMAFEYVQWLHSEREISVRTELLVWRSILYVGKFLYHDKSQILPGSGDKSYSDLLVVKELRALIGRARKQEKVAGRTSDESLKWLDWPDYLETVQELKKECAAINGSTGKERAPKDIAASVQRYLIFGILACIPDRQRTIRELQINKNLFKDSNGRWVIVHGASDYKTGKAYGERPPLVLSQNLYPELEAFVEKWRAELHPQHSFLFSQMNGLPFSDKQLYKMFWTTCFRISGKRMSPHMVRDSVVTHMRRSDASERELQSLALLMGHSVEIQRSSYDRRTKNEKIEPAVSLLSLHSHKLETGEL